MRQISSLFIVLLSLSGAAVAADWNLDGDQSWCKRTDSRRACEVRSLMSDGFTGRLDVDPGGNGGITVVGTGSGGSMSIEAKVTTWKGTDPKDVRIEVSGGDVRAYGPDGGNWGVSLRIEVPRRTDVELNAFNGGITLRDLDGQVRFRTKNGGVTLENLSGDIQGQSMNGGVTVKFDESAFFGEGLDVETKNGGVTLVIPEGFSADLETSTVNGSIHTEFPIEVNGKLSNKLDVRLGGGGSPIRLVTKNGGVKIAKL